MQRNLDEYCSRPNVQRQKRNKTQLYCNYIYIFGYRKRHKQPQIHPLRFDRTGIKRSLNFQIKRVLEHSKGGIADWNLRTVILRFVTRRSLPSSCLRYLSQIPLLVSIPQNQYLGARYILLYLVSLKSVTRLVVRSMIP
jgi:hypothetical protein